MTTACFTNEARGNKSYAAGAAAMTSGMPNSVIPVAKSCTLLSPVSFWVLISLGAHK